MQADIQGFEAHVAAIPQMESQYFSEADTRAYLIDPVLRLLGYTGFGDIRREVAVPATKEFLDYELRVEGKPWAIVEAKAVRHSIVDSAAAQCVQYASVLGHRWCIITNGITWSFYDAHQVGPLAAKKIAQVEVTAKDEAFRKAWNVLCLMSKDAVLSGVGLEELLVERVIRAELNEPNSSTIAALRKALIKGVGKTMTPAAVIDALARVNARPVERFLSGAIAPTANQTKMSPSVANAAPTVQSVPVAQDEDEDVDDAPGGRRVRLRHLVMAGLIRPGDVLAGGAGIDQVTAIVLDNGTLDCGGTQAANLLKAAKSLGAPVSGARVAWEFWKTASGESMKSVRQRFVDSSNGNE